MNLIKKLLGLEYTVESKPYRRLIRVYGERGLSNITKITTTKKQNKTIIHVWSHHPGIFIGEKGNHVSMLRDIISRVMDTEVEFDLRDAEIFNDLFDSYIK